MGQTLTHGIYLPSEGERNCYSGLAANWNAVDTLKGNYSLHAINVGIHVTAAEKETWNSKADDADVVHKSGAENIDGKTFLTSSYFYNTAEGAATPSIYIRSNKAEIGGSTGTDNARVTFLDKNNQILNYIQFRKGSNGISDLTFYVITKDANDTTIASALTFYKAKDGTSVFRTTIDNDVALGDNNKFKDVRTYLINGINPGALFLPAQSYVDISAYFTNTGTGELNTYTPPANGWIFLRLGSISSCQAQILDSSDNLLWGVSTSGSVEMFTIPILSGCKLRTQWATGSAVNVATARFYPCQGNI